MLIILQGLETSTGIVNMKKDFGSTGRREYFRVQIERDILKDDCGSGRFF